MTPREELLEGKRLATEMARARSGTIRHREAERLLIVAEWLGTESMYPHFQEEWGSGHPSLRMARLLREQVEQE